MSLRRVGAGTALMLAGAFFTSAQAAPITGGESTKRLVDPYAMAEKAQVFVWGGRRHCFYYDAWNGPGWYWCDYAWRRGYGWGGGPGWHGWRHQSRPRTYSDRRPRVERQTHSRSLNRGTQRAAPAQRRGIRDGRSGQGKATQSRGARSDGARSGRSNVNRSGARSGGGRGVSSGRSGGGGSATSGRSGGGSATSGRSGGGGRGGRGG